MALMIVLMGIQTLTCGIQLVKSVKNWVVDDDGPADFHTIQEAINAASERDAIYVKIGTYYEHVTINKTVVLIGENEENTCINGNRTGTVVYVTANDVVISGFTVCNSGSDWDEYGILVRSSNTTIKNNKVAENGMGISFEGSSGSIMGNAITKNTHYGIDLLCHNSTIYENSVSANGEGIVFTNSFSNIVYGNNVTTNNCEGIYLRNSCNNTFRYNCLDGNEFNFKVVGNELIHYIQNIDLSNTMYGKPVYYLINRHNLIINSQTFPNIGYLALINSTNILIHNLSLGNNNNEGLLFSYTKDSQIIGNNLTNNWCGVRLFSSSNNTVYSNDLSNNVCGIYLHQSFNNVVYGNNMTANGDSGIFLLDGSFNNTIYENNVVGNKGRGIRLRCTYNNTIFHNNFINNTRPFFDYAFESEKNTWDNGYPSGGNYWSDHGEPDLYSGPYQNETGSDGIVDEPYVIDWSEKIGNNIDRYPSASPYVSYEEMRAIYSELLQKYKDVQEEYTNLNATYNELKSIQDTTLEELNKMRSLTYILLTTTIVFALTTIYLVASKTKRKHSML